MYLLPENVAGYLDHGYPVVEQALDGGARRRGAGAVAASCSRRFACGNAHILQLHPPPVTRITITPRQVIGWGGLTEIEMMVTLPPMTMGQTPPFHMVGVVGSRWLDEKDHLDSALEHHPVRVSVLLLNTTGLARRPQAGAAEAAAAWPASMPPSCSGNGDGGGGRPRRWLLFLSRRWVMPEHGDGRGVCASPARLARTRYRARRWPGMALAGQA